MKKAFKIVILLILFALYIVSFLLVRLQYVSYSGLNKGDIYISDESFYSNRELFLAGEWEFYFGEITDSGGFASKEQRNYYYLPDYWQRNWNDKSVDINGYGSYRVQIAFETPKENVTLYIPWIFGAYDVYANGIIVLKCGRVGKTPQSEITDVRSQSVVIPLRSDTMELIIHVSGHISGLSGLLNPIAIGSDASVFRYIAMQIAQDAIFIGCFFIMGFYHLAMFFLRKKDKATLYFALLCFVMMLRQGTISYGLLYDILPKNSGFLAYDMYILVTIWVVALFGIFSYYLFGKKYCTGNKNILALVAVCIIKTIFELLHTYYFSFAGFYLGYTCIILCFIYLFRIIYLINRHKDKYRSLYTYGALFLILANGSDILRDFGIINAGAILGNTAFLIFTFIETIILARTYVDFSYENERLLGHMEALVNERTAELAEANEQLLLMEHTKNELISNISHDLRTPMTAIRGYMELLMSNGEKDYEVNQEYIESAHIRTSQMENLIKDLFLLTQLTEKRTQINITPVDISEFLQTYYKSCKPVVEQKEINLVLKGDAMNAKIQADRGFLTRIMDNLIQNALYYAKSKIIINGKIKDGNIILSVTDDGPGIDKETLPNVFDRFYKKRKDGAGLGLSIVKELTHALGGEVFADSIPNERTEFGIKLKLQK